MTFELETVDDRVRLVLTHRKLEDPDTRLDVTSGWHTHLTLLAAVLEGRTPPAFWPLFEALEEAYPFEGPEGPASLLDLFAGRRQLIAYHFMFGPDWEAGCDGCSWVVDAMTHLAHLHARDTTLVLVSRAPLEKLERYKARMGWRHPPWYSSHGSDFNHDMGVTSGDKDAPDTDRGERHGISVFLRDGQRVFRTYFTGRRGVEYLGSLWSYLDLTPYGRQETWEDSPPGWPQTPPYVWNRRHDEYDT